MERKPEEITEWSSKTDKPFCFVVAGEIGAGKSTLVNSIVNKDIAKTSSGASSVTSEVVIYDEVVEVPQTGGDNLKVKVRVADTPGLNDEKISFVQIFRAVSDKVPHPHALFYCFQMNNRFKHSDRQLLSAMSRCYGVDIWKRVVIVLTFADRAKTPMEDMKSYKKAIIKFLADEIKLDECISSKIPFCFAALGNSFVLHDAPQGEGQGQGYNWKIALLASAMSVAPPEIVPMILQLHEKEILTWFGRNGYKVVGVTSVVSFILAIGFGAAAIAFPIAAPILAPAATVLAIQATVGSTGGAGAIGFTASGTFLIKVCRDKYAEYKQLRQVGNKNNTLKLE